MAAGTGPLIVVAGRTAPNRTVVFGGEHDDLDARGRAWVAALAPQVPCGRPVRIGPEASVRQSAAALGLIGDVEPALATLDVGSWRGRSPEHIPDADLAAWFGDPAAAPHGGETVAAFVARIGACRARWTVDDRPAVLVVAKPVAQALLCDDARRFFATELRPASLHRLPGSPAAGIRFGGSPG